jgi:hypothetical protein
MRLAVVVLLVACSSKGPADPVFTPAGPKPCEQMADHLVGLMTPVGADGKPLKKETETADAISRTLVKRCTEDKWTADAQRCFTTIASLEAADKCAPLLTVEQRESMDRAMDAALGPKPDSGGSGSAAPKH